MIKLLNSSTYGDNKPYLTNSIKNFYQTILKLSEIKKIEIKPTAFKAYKLEFLKYDITSRTEEPNKHDEIITFEELLKKIKEIYGDDSREYLIISIYQYFGFRDNLQLKIIRDETEATDEKENYIFLNNKKATILLNNYKTSNKYKTQKIEIKSHKLYILLVSYILKNDIKHGAYLFGKKKLSANIRAFNKKLGLDITINNLRQMRASEEMEKADTPAKKVNLSLSMSHSTTTTPKYLREFIAKGVHAPKG